MPYNLFGNKIKNKKNSMHLEPLYENNLVKCNIEKSFKFVLIFHLEKISFDAILL